MIIRILVAHSNLEVWKQVSEALDSLAVASSNLSFVQTQVSDAVNARGSLITTAFDAIVIDSLLPTEPGAESTTGDYAGLAAFLSKQAKVPPTLILVDVDPDSKLSTIIQRIHRAQFLLPNDDLKQGLANLISVGRRRKQVEPSARLALHFSLSNLSCDVEYSGGRYPTPSRFSKPLPIQYPHHFHKLLENTRHLDPFGTKQWSLAMEDHGSAMFAYLRDRGLDEYYYTALEHCGNRPERLQMHFDMDPGLDDVPLEHLVDYERGEPYFLMLRSPMTRSLNVTGNSCGDRAASIPRSPRILCIFSDVADGSVPLTEEGTYREVHWPDAFGQLRGLEKEREFFNGLKKSIPNVRILPDGDAERGVPLRELLEQEIGDRARRKPRYDIVHFAGHGHTHLLKERNESKTFLMLARPDGFYVDPLPIETFVDWLRGCGTRLIFLNACSTGSSSTAYAIVRAGIPAAIGFRWTISDTAAPHLMQNFYERLNRARDVSEALRHAMDRVYHNGFAADPIWAAPMVVVPRHPKQPVGTLQEARQ
jgi:hypothetical protein